MFLGNYILRIFRSVYGLRDCHMQFCRLPFFRELNAHGKQHLAILALKKCTHLFILTFQFSPPNISQANILRYSQCFAICTSLMQYKHCSSKEKECMRIATARTDGPFSKLNDFVNDYYRATINTALIETLCLHMYSCIKKLTSI